MYGLDSVGKSHIAEIDGLTRKVAAVLIFEAFGDISKLSSVLDIPVPRFGGASVFCSHITGTSSNLPTMISTG